MGEGSILRTPEVLMFDCYFLEGRLVCEVVNLCRRLLAEIHFGDFGEELDVVCSEYLRDGAFGDLWPVMGVSDQGLD